MATERVTDKLCIQLSTSDRNITEPGSPRMRCKRPPGLLRTAQCMEYFMQAYVVIWPAIGRLEGICTHSHGPAVTGIQTMVQTHDAHPCSWHAIGFPSSVYTSFPAQCNAVQIAVGYFGLVTMSCVACSCLLQRSNVFPIHYNPDSAHDRTLASVSAETECRPKVLKRRSAETETKPNVNFSRVSAPKPKFGQALLWCILAVKAIFCFNSLVKATRSWNGR